ncbi:MAG: carboxypeptidase-like regulatory domain-containing protein [Flavobacteriales bacterium]|nr:carboxypeptidase-like regulatory domain-containing protein [Flavobacteriales bacterium]
MSKKPESQRDYNFSDGVLMQLTDTVIGNGNRDTAELTPEGVTPARLTDLGTLNDTFRDMPDDVEWAGLLSERTEEKDAALEVCATGVRNIRRMAANIFGEGKPKYRRFGFDSINSLKDADRIREYFRIHRRAVQNAALLAPEGLTATVLADFRAACEAADDAYDVMVDTIEDRDEATEDRVELGNEIYAEVVKICNTGKTYWFDRSEAKYNDYVITPSGTTANMPPVQAMNLTGKAAHSVTSAPLFNVEVTIMRTNGNVIVLTDAGGNYAANGMAVVAPENVQVRFKLVGFDDRTENITLVPGVNQVLNVLMTPPVLPPPMP